MISSNFPSPPNFISSARDSSRALLFCLTVDRYGHDYLKTMCADIGYEVVPDIESLPSRITTLYRQLTA